MPSHFLYKTTAIITAFIALTVAFSACTKGSLVGADLLPASDNIGLYYDSSGHNPALNISSLTVAEDSVVVYTPNSSLVTRFLFGRVSDPQFGELSSSIYAQLRLSAAGIDLAPPLSTRSPLSWRMIMMCSKFLATPRSRSLSAFIA